MGPSTMQIVPVVVGDAGQAVARMRASAGGRGLRAGDQAADRPPGTSAPAADGDGDARGWRAAARRRRAARAARSLRAAMLAGGRRRRPSMRPSSPARPLRHRHGHRGRQDPRPARRRALRPEGRAGASSAGDHRPRRPGPTMRHADHELLAGRGGRRPDDGRALPVRAPVAPPRRRAGRHPIEPRGSRVAAAPPTAARCSCSRASAACSCRCRWATVRDLAAALGSRW